MDRKNTVIVVERNGQTTVVTGWKAWLLTLGALLSGVAALVFLGFVLLGLAVTVGAVLLVVVPAAILVALVGMLLGRRG